MVCGIFGNLLLILYKSANPKIVISKEKIDCHEVAVVEVRENLCYSSAEYLKLKIIKFVTNAQEDGNVRLLFLKGENITNIDVTVALVRKS